MTAINQDQLIKKVTRWSISVGILTIIAGFLAISLPLATGLGLAVLLGVIFSFVGIAQVVFAFRSFVLCQPLNKADEVISVFCAHGVQCKS